MNIEDRFSRRWPWWLAVYFFTAWLLLSWLLPGGRTDDSEALYLAQSLAWGYEAKNPPLFYWLTWVLTQFTGPSNEAVFFIRMTALWLTFVGCHRLAQLLTPDTTLAFAAAMAPLLVLQFNWYALRDLTHTVLAMAAYVWLVIALFQTIQTPSLKNYLLMALVAVAGLHSKYVFLLFLLACAIALTLNTAGRRLIFHRHTITALLLMLALGIPHGWWLLQAKAVVASQMQYSMGLDPGLAPFSGPYSMAQSLAALLILPLGITLLACCPKTLWQRQVTHDLFSVRRAIVRDSVLISLLALMVAIPLGLRTIKPHHLCFLVPGVVWLVARIPVSELSQKQARRFIKLALAWSLTCLIAFGLSSRYKEMDDDCLRCSEYLPYQAYAEALKQAGFEGGTVIALGNNRRLNAAGLREWFPDSRFIQHDMSQLYTPPPRHVPGDCLLLWSNKEDEEVLHRVAQGQAGPYPIVLADGQQGILRGQFIQREVSAADIRYALFRGGVGECR